MKINERDFDEFGFPVSDSGRIDRSKSKTKKNDSRYDDWAVENKKKREKPWRGKTNRRT
jgi:hypothetical protein